MARGVEGIDRVGRFLTKLPAAVNAELAKETERSAQDVAALARALAPVDSGAVRASIDVVAGPTELTRYVTAGNDEAWYARLIISGTKPHVNKGQFAGTQNPGLKPVNFLGAAVRTLRKTIRARMGRAIGRGIRKAAP